jgi:hypothetical protein
MFDNNTNIPKWALPALITVGVGVATIFVILVGNAIFGGNNNNKTKVTTNQSSIQSSANTTTKSGNDPFIPNQEGEQTDNQQSSSPVTITVNTKSIGSLTTDPSKVKVKVCDLMLTYNKPTDPTLYQTNIECQPKNNSFFTGIESVLRVKATDVSVVDKSNYSIIGKDLKDKISVLMKSTVKDGKASGIISYEQIGFEYNNNLYIISLEPTLLKTTNPTINLN